MCNDVMCREIEMEKENKKRKKIRKNVHILFGSGYLLCCVQILCYDIVQILIKLFLNSV